PVPSSAPGDALFPYATLFRSRAGQERAAEVAGGIAHRDRGREAECLHRHGSATRAIPAVDPSLAPYRTRVGHTRSQPKSRAQALHRKSTRLNSSHRTTSYAVF